MASNILSSCSSHINIFGLALNTVPNVGQKFVIYLGQDLLI